MRDDDLRNLLRERNPWWRASAGGTDPVAWAVADPILKGAAGSGIDFDTDVLSDAGPTGGLWVLRGPRRVGKSVALKRLAARFCSTHEPLRLIYMAVDTFQAKDLRRAFTLGRALTAGAGAGDGPRLWLVDEVTSVPGWERLVKELRDNTQLAHDGVVLTGSSAGGMLAAVQALGAGRTNVREPFRMLLPMTFGEVVGATGAQVPVPNHLNVSDLQSLTARREIERLVPFADELDLLWQQYLESGGFPRAVGSAHRRGEVDGVFANDLLSWLSTDVIPGDPADSATELLTVLHRRSGSPLDVTNAADQLHTTRDRLRLRLDRLVSTFGAIWCHQVNDDGNRRTGSQSKLYLADPLLARLPSLVDPTAQPPDFTRSTEASLGVAVARAINALHPSRYVEQRAVGYTRTGSGGEIDFAAVPIAVGSGRTVSCPIESKWVTDGWKGEARAVHGKYRRGIVATKNITDLSGPVWAVPAPVLALLLEG